MSAISSDSKVRGRMRKRQGFNVYTLSNNKMEIAVVPELGAKIISLKNLQTGREWLWHPGNDVALFRNRLGDDFSKSPLTGIDECLPTIAPCRWQACDLPDHGEAWTAPWSVNANAWENQILHASTKLKLSPFLFERTIELSGDEVRLNYQLTNQSDAERTYLWAIHPLLRLQPGDSLVLPSATRALLNGEKWISDLYHAPTHGACAKLFAAPVADGFAAIENKINSNRLEFHWDPSENNTLGLWLSQGGWHGHHHFAIEPTNGEPDSLESAAARNRCGILPGSGSAKWQITLKVI
jgi:galactose mutarotase-like enzyme